MSILTRPFEEMLKYILTRLHGGILQNQLDHKHFSAYVTEGLYVLQNLTLNPAAVNRGLSESPIHLTSATIGCIKIQLPPVYRIFQTPISITIKNANIECCNALHSGYGVAKEELIQHELDQNIQGVTLLTKAIGNFLSNIQFDMHYLVVKLRNRPSDADFLRLFLPYISLEDKLRKSNISHKLLSVKSAEISLLDEHRDVYLPTDPARIVVIDEEIRSGIIFSREELIVTSQIPSIKSVVSAKDLHRVQKILGNLAKSELIEQTAGSLLVDVYQEFKGDIETNADLPEITIRSKKFSVSVEHLVAAAAFESIPHKIWVYEGGNYPGIMDSHIILTLNRTSFKMDDSNYLTAKGASVTYYGMIEELDMTDSDMFVTAQQEYTADFFRQSGELRRFQSTEILGFQGSEDVLIIHQYGQSISIHTKPVVVKLSDQILENLKKLNSKNNQQKGNLDLNLDISHILLEYQFSLDQTANLISTIHQLKGNINSGLEVQQIKCAVSIDNQEHPLCRLLGLSICSFKPVQVSKSVRTEDFPFTRYTESNQGSIIIPSFTSESEKMVDFSDHSFEFTPVKGDKYVEDEMKQKFQILYRLEIGNAEVFVIPEFKRIFEEFGEKESSSSQLGIEYSIQNIRISFLEKSLDPFRQKIIECEGKHIRGLFLKERFEYQILEIGQFQASSNSQIFFKMHGEPILVKKMTELEISVQDFSVFTDVLLSLLPYLQTYQSSSKQSSTLAYAIHIQNMLVDHLAKQTRLLAFIENFRCQINQFSKSMTIQAVLNALSLFVKPQNQDRRDLFPHCRIHELPVKIPEFAPIGSIQLLELSSTIIKNSRFDCKIFDRRLTRCPFGSGCVKMGSQTYFAQSVPARDSPEDWLDTHITVGCIMLHFCKDSLQALQSLIEVPETEEGEPRKTVKDSGISSDDSDSYSISIYDLSSNLLSPEKPFVNLQDYLGPPESDEIKLPKLERIISIHNLELPHLHRQLPPDLEQAFTLPIYESKPEHGFTQQKLSIGVSYISVKFYSGSDFGGREGPRDIFNSLSVDCKSLGALYTTFNSVYAWKFSSNLQSLEVLDRVHNSFSEKLFAGASDDGSFATLQVEAVRSSMFKEIELIIDCDVQPIRIILDQYTLDFLIEFVGLSTQQQKISRNLGAADLSQSQRSNQEARGTYIQKFTIDSVICTIDYIPHSMIDSSSHTGLLNLFRVDKLVLHLPRAVLVGVLNFEKVSQRLWAAWGDSLSGRQMIRMAANVGPLSSVRNIGAAFYDLLAVPASDRPMEKTRGVFLGILKALSIEGLSFTEEVMSISYSVIHGIGSTFGLNLPSTMRIVSPLQNARQIIDKKQYYNGKI